MGGDTSKTKFNKQEWPIVYETNLYKVLRNKVTNEEI